MKQANKVSGRDKAGELPSVEVRIADRLRVLRQDKGLTLAQLAALADTSQAFLSRVENHRASLTIAGLEKIAAALNTPLKYFFETDESTAPLVVCRAGEGERRLMRGPKGFKSLTLAAEKKGKLMEPLVVDIASAREPMPLMTHAGEEFNYVLEGECDLHYGKQVIHLQAGDSAYYDAGVPHATRAVEGKPCRLLAVVSSREYLFHGDLSKLLQSESDK